VMAFPVAFVREIRFHGSEQEPDRDDDQGQGRSLLPSAPAQQFSEQGFSATSPKTSVRAGIAKSAVMRHCGKQGGDP
jgi:hypothetical protein